MPTESLQYKYYLLASDKKNQIMLESVSIIRTLNTVSTIQFTLDINIKI